MRSRNIKPSFFKNEYLAELPAITRLLFIGLWCMADREGRLEDRPKKIKNELFPEERIDVNKNLDLLAESREKFIIRYEANGEKYIQITNFNKHQSPHIKESASNIPAPDLSDTKTSQAHLIPDSLNLIPDSPLLTTDTPDQAVGLYDDNLASLNNLAGKNINGNVPIFYMNQFAEMLDDGFEKSVIEYAITETGRQGKGYPYLGGILKNFMDNQIKTQEQLERHRQTHKKPADFSEYDKLSREF